MGLWCRKFSSPGIKPESGLVALSNGGCLGHVARGVALAANHCFGSPKWSEVKVMVVGGRDRR